MNWTKILNAFSAWLPEVVKVDEKVIAVSAAIKEAAQEAQVWTADREAIHQAAADKLMANATNTGAPLSGNATGAEPAPAPVVFSEPTAEAKPEASTEANDEAPQEQPQAIAAAAEQAAGEQMAQKIEADPNSLG